MSNDFTIKEMLIKIDEKLDSFISDNKKDFKDVDLRIDILEQYREATKSNFKLIAWIVTASGVIFGVIKLVLFL